MDITPYRLDLFFIRETALQIIKDFDLFAIEIQFSGNEQTAYQELKSQLIPILSELIKNDYQKFHAILYRIDITEANITHALHMRSNQDRADWMSDLIIDRELKKVIIRKMYSENQDLFKLRDKDTDI